MPQPAALWPSPRCVLWQRQTSFKLSICPKSTQLHSRIPRIMSNCILLGFVYRHFGKQTTGQGQIPLDGHGLNQIGPDQTRPDKCSCLGSPTKSPTCLVLAKFHYTGPTRLCRRLSQKNPPRKTRPQRNCCRFFNYTSMQLRVYY